jgi:predicted FMN-binding regulatory protein PaiB
VLAIHDDERFVRSLVARPARRHEAAELTPWKMGDSAREYIDSRLRDIVGLEIAITSLVGKAKLSLNGYQIFIAQVVRTNRPRLRRAPRARWDRPRC